MGVCCLAVGSLPYVLGWFWKQELPELYFHLCPSGKQELGNKLIPEWLKPYAWLFK